MRNCTLISSSAANSVAQLKLQVDFCFSSQECEGETCILTWQAAYMIIVARLFQFNICIVFRRNASGNNISRATCANTFSYRKLICCNSNNLPLKAERARAGPTGRILYMISFQAYYLQSAAQIWFVLWAANLLLNAWMFLFLHLPHELSVCPKNQTQRQKP